MLDPDQQDYAIKNIFLRGLIRHKMTGGKPKRIGRHRPPCRCIFLAERQADGRAARGRRVLCEKISKGAEKATGNAREREEKQDCGGTRFLCKKPDSPAPLRQELLEWLTVTPMSLRGMK